MPCPGGWLAAVFFLWAAAAVPSGADAGHLDCIFEHYSTDDGLPHNSIADIHQDRNGYIWLCTWYGLSRFDGNTFVNYTTLPGDYANLSHNRFLSVREDVNGYLWLTTYDYKLYRFDKSVERFVAVPDDLDHSGLSRYKVDKFYCDSRGDTWIALQDYGLCKVTSSLELEDYSSSYGIGKDIKAIYGTSDGTVYVDSEAGVAAVSGGETSLVSRLPGVAAFTEFGGRLYFGYEDMLRVLDKGSGVQTTIDLSALGAGRLTCMQVAGGAEKSLYIGFSGGAIGLVDTLSGRVSPVRSDMGRVRYLFPDSGGLLWVATDRTGMWSYSPRTGRFRHYEHPRNVMSYYTDTLARVIQRGERTWVKMNGYGFGWYDRDNDSIVPLYNVKGQPGNRFMNGVACFEVDSSGVLWFSTVKRGLERVTVMEPKVRVVSAPALSEDRMAASEVRAMTRDSRDNIWVATKSGELFLYSPDLTSCRRIPESSSIGLVYSIFEDKSGYIWLGTKGNGLVRVDISGDRYSYRHFRHDPYDKSSLSSDNVYSVAQDSIGRIWVGTFGGGLSMLPGPESTEFRTVYNDFPLYPLESGDRVRYLHCMPDGRMLAGTVGGLVWFYPDENTELTEFNLVRKIPGDPHSIGNNDIIYIFEDNARNTWLCTYGGGINRLWFDGGCARFDNVSTAQGLSSNIVLSAVCDMQGDIWLATESGISRIGGDSGKIANYTKYDGILSTTFSEATCARLADGGIAFGTLDNIHVIIPSDFTYSPEPARLVLSGIEVDGRRVPMGSEGEKIVIPHTYSFFRIDFSSLNYKVQHDMRYSYKLDGYDKDWISAGSGSSVTYSRIPHGRYRFMVRSSSGEGDAVSVPIRVRPSLWESTPAVIFYVLVAVGIFAVLARMFLTSERLKSEMKLEQKMNDLKVRFFTNISHELRTPLTLIMGGAEELRKDATPGSRDEYSANIVFKNARRMMTLVDQLLDIRRIVSGKMRLEVSCFDMVKLVQDVYDDFKDMAAERRIGLGLSRPDDPLMMWGDSGRLEALVYNLLSNAFKYTPDGGHIALSVYRTDAQDEVCITVKDDGVGVPKDKQEAIFEPFVQASHSARRDMSGSGIGLSFCKEIVQMHGGRIWVESQGSGRGSCFWVTLPAGKGHFSEDSAEFVDPDADAVSYNGPEAAGLSKYRLKPSFKDGALKVLVVEDNAELKVYIYNSLVDKYDVRDASDGEEAMQVITSGWMPDMVITDLMMPRLDGIGLINRIRSDFSTSHIPIILITARYEDDTHLKAMKYGADGYITKPFTMELLIARMENLLERRRTLLSALSGGVAGQPAGKPDPKAGKVTISPSEVVITDRDKELIDKVMKWLEENISDSDVTVDSLAVYVGMGRTSMYNKLKGLTGKSPVELIQDYRLEKATYYLKSGQMSVSETSYKVGFSDPGYFSRSFKKHFGISPADYIKENRPKSGQDDRDTGDAAPPSVRQPS